MNWTLLMSTGARCLHHHLEAFFCSCLSIPENWNRFVCVEWFETQKPPTQVFGFVVTCKHTKVHNGVHLRVGKCVPSWTESVLARLERPVGAILNDMIWKWNHGDRWNDRSGAVINHISFCGVGLGWGLDGKNRWMWERHDCKITMMAVQRMWNPF